MCGHGTIGVATVLVETGMVEVTEPVTTIRLDTPAGLVIARVAVSDGHADAVTIENVPAFCDRLDATSTCPATDASPTAWRSAATSTPWSTRRRRAAVRPVPQGRHPGGRAGDHGRDQQHRPAEAPADRGIDHVHHVQFVAPGSDAAYSRHAMAIYPGWFDRSPCGTGTSARMAELHARGELALDTDFVNESFIGSRFVGRLVGTAAVGDRPAVIPTVTGRAWVTGIGQYLLDPTDPFPQGFVF